MEKVEGKTRIKVEKNDNLNKKEPSSTKKKFSSFFEDTKFSSGEKKEELPSPMHVFQTTPIIQEHLSEVVSDHPIKELSSLLFQKISLMVKKDLSSLLFEYTSDGILNGLEVRIDFYNTDPKGFHIHFEGTDQAVQLLAKETSRLQTELQNSFQQFRFHIVSPSLKPEYYEKKIGSNKKSDLTKAKGFISSKITPIK